MPKKTVYISSTYKDLKEYRDAIRNMFLYKGLQEEYTLISMEGYVAENQKPAIDVCLEDVSNADIYILILAKNYGSIFAETGKSYTEMEYDQAMVTAKTNSRYKIFVYYSDDQNEKNVFKDKPNLQNNALKNFYNKVMSNHACFTNPFTTPDNLCKQILLTFNFNFKESSNESDFNEALLLVDRVKPSYSFSRLIRKNVNSYTFISQYANNPHDFIERISGFEMAGKYNKCKIDLSQFTTTQTDKFRHTLHAQLSSQWAKDIEPIKFNDDEKLLLSIDINSVEIESDLKLDCLCETLVEFLPKYLISHGQTSPNRVLFIFYNFYDPDDNNIDKFDAFIKKLSGILQIEGCLTSMDRLGDVTKLDAENWLNTYVKHEKHPWSQEMLDELLGIEGNPFKTSSFKMKDIKKLILDWLENNFFKK